MSDLPLSDRALAQIQARREAFRQRQADAETAHLKQLVGQRIVNVVTDLLDGQNLYGLVLSNGSVAWILCDPEGNGPGHLQIELPGPSVTQPKPGILLTMEFDSEHGEDAAYTKRLIAGQIAGPGRKESLGRCDQSILAAAIRNAKSIHQQTS